ncbi:MAG: Hsp20/alpha crystallin family protein [Anaerolineales bacterium]|nr:Hsp20/alpha crystallin family protein [Anaerolineales bacterium]
MSLTIRPYYRPIRLTEMMDRLFDETLTRGYPAPAEALNVPLDVQAKDDEYVIYASVPGLKADDLEIEVLGNTVTLRGEVFAPAAEEKASWLLQERAGGKFSRSLTLPAELDSGKVDASLENGVLSLRLPKAEAARPKAIKVRVR